ncbi:Os01g0318000, partial [Oryza sativa Japonica Group]
HHPPTIASLSCYRRDEPEGERWLTGSKTTPPPPTWHLAFSRGNMPDRSFKVPWKRALAVARPRSTMAPPRAATARELLRVCCEVQSRFQEVELPLLVVHGGDDTLCDPECAEELHRRAGSEDKTLRVYPGMWHQLVGEPEENVDKVFGDVLDWFKSHAAAAAATPGEGQQ